MLGVLEGVMPTATEAREQKVADLIKAPASPRVLQMPGRVPKVPWLPERPMFADSLLDSSRRDKKRRRFATGFSFFFQCLLIGVLLIVPMMFTEALPTQQLLTFLVAPPPPPPPPPAAQAAAVIRQVQSDVLTSGQLRTPSRIPQQVQMIREEEAPPMLSTGGVVGGVPGGVPGGQLGGVIGGIVGQTSNLAIVPKLAMPARPIRVSRGVTEGLLLRKVAPEYPMIARQGRIQGQVLLSAIISKTGDIEHLILISGHPLLVPAAIEAVKQWHYRPYLLNGEPVDVETTISVMFVLSQ
jgi:periplasmic protein TonB